MCATSIGLCIWDVSHPVLKSARNAPSNLGLMQTLTATCDNTPSIIAITILAFHPKLKLLPSTISLDLTTRPHGRDFIDAFFFFVSSWYFSPSRPRSHQLPESRSLLSTPRGASVQAHGESA